MELVVAQIQRSIDGLEWLKIDVYSLLLAIIRQNGPTVNNQTVIRNSGIQLKLLLRRGNSTQHRQSEEIAMRV